MAGTAVVENLRKNMSFCAVLNCGSVTTQTGEGDNKITFHGFPKHNYRRRSEWIKATCKKNFNPTSYSKICSRHFTKECFFTNSKMRMLTNAAIPTLFLPKQAPDDNAEKNDYYLKLERDNNNILSQLENVESLLNHIYETNDDQFDIFSRLVSAQLKSLPIEHAVKLKFKLEEVIFQYRKSLIQDGVLFPGIMNMTDENEYAIKGSRRVNRVLPAWKIPIHTIKTETIKENTLITPNTDTNDNTSECRPPKINLPDISVDKPTSKRITIINSDEDDQNDSKSINTAHIKPSVNEIPEPKESLTIKEEDKFENTQCNLKIVSVKSLGEESTSSDDEYVQIELAEETNDDDDEDDDSDDNTIETETPNGNIQMPNDKYGKSYVRVKRFASEAEFPNQEAKKLKK